MSDESRVKRSKNILFPLGSMVCFLCQAEDESMAHETIDISNNPDLLRIAEEMRRRNTSTVLRNGNEDVAIMTPVADAAKRTTRGSPIKKKSAAAMAIFLSSAGGWKDLVDTNKLKADIYERRRLPIRPRPEL
jgi:hypothetical protein